MTTSVLQESRYWKQAFIVFSILLIIVMPLISRDYGQTGDEWLQLDYGEHIWNYFVHGDKQALDYTNKSRQYAEQEYYGGLFDFSATVLHKALPSVHILTLRHFLNAIYGALFMIFTGLLAYRLTKKWALGVIALLFMVFSPHIFGESMNNPKDIPFATGFIIGIYGLIALLQDFPRKLYRNIALITIGWGIAFGVRSAGGILLIGYFAVFIGLYYFMNKPFREMISNDKKSRNKLIISLLAAFVVGYIIGLAAWPWGLQDPINHPLESLKGMTNRVTNIPVLFEGMIYMAAEMPWHYEFKWIFISNPLIILLGVILFVVFIQQNRKAYGNYIVIILLFGALFPLLYMVYKHSTVYDTWRHVFFVYPFWVIAGAIGIEAIGIFIKQEKLRWLPYGIAIAGLLPAIIWTIRTHPNQTVYFNETVGGVAGAHGYYDTDYYQNSGKQAADWIRQNVKPVPGRKIKVLSNLSGIWYYFDKDTSWISSDYGRYEKRHSADWDYFITYSRYVSPRLLQNNMWPPKNTIHQIAVDGAPLTVILARKCPDAHKSLYSKNISDAIAKYESCIRSGATDGDTYFNYAIALVSANKLPEAEAALKMAINADKDNIEYWDMLAKIYEATNNTAEYQKAAAEIQKILAGEQEYISSAGY